MQNATNVLFHWFKNYERSSVLIFRPIGSHGKEKKLKFGPMALRTHGPSEYRDATTRVL